MSAKDLSSEYVDTSLFPMIHLQDFHEDLFVCLFETGLHCVPLAGLELFM